MFSLKLSHMPINGMKVTFSAILVVSALTGCTQSKWREVGRAAPDTVLQNQEPPAPPLPQTEVPRPNPQVPPNQGDRTPVPVDPPAPPPNTDGGGKSPPDSGKNPGPNPQPVPVQPPPQPQTQGGGKNPPAPQTQNPTTQRPSTQRPPEPIECPVTGSPDRYFVVQNIATGKLRVYENCYWDRRVHPSQYCSHKMVIETDMISGEDQPARTRRVVLGSFEITKWFKFYEDNTSSFPSWYHPQYPMLPPPGASLADWASPSLLPQGRGAVRGGFGWYTAHIGPNSSAQWMHGTLGWGADRDRFIKVSGDELSRYYNDPQGYGCTRVENQAIALMRDILPVGTKVIRVYAKEAYHDANRSRYASLPRLTYDWILTKDGVDTNGLGSSRKRVVARGVPQSSILEAGTYDIDRIPDAIPFIPNAAPSTQTGNVYDLRETSMAGCFLVDEGRFVDYDHPRELRVGGFDNQLLPPIVLARSAQPLASQPNYAPGRKQERLGQQRPARHPGRPGAVLNQ